MAPRFRPLLSCTQQAACAINSEFDLMCSLSFKRCRWVSIVLALRFSRCAMVFHAQTLADPFEDFQLAVARSAPAADSSRGGHAAARGRRLQQAAGEAWD